MVFDSEGRTALLLEVFVVESVPSTDDASPVKALQEPDSPPPRPPVNPPSHNPLPKLCDGEELLLLLPPPLPVRRGTSRCAFGRGLRSLDGPASEYLSVMSGSVDISLLFLGRVSLEPVRGMLRPLLIPPLLLSVASSLLRSELECEVILDKCGAGKHPSPDSSQPQLYLGQSMPPIQCRHSEVVKMITAVHQLIAFLCGVVIV